MRGGAKCELLPQDCDRMTTCERESLWRQRLLPALGEERGITEIVEKTIEVIRSTIQRVGKIDVPGAGDDFYAAGFSSISALELLVELETAFDVSIPDDEFIGARSIGGLAEVIQRLRQKGNA